MTIKNHKINEDERMLGMLSHLLAIFTHWIGPLIFFLVKSEKKGFAYENAKHSLNFQISLIIYYVASVVLIFTIIGIILSVVIWVALPIFSLIVEIVGSVKAHQGEVYKYPLEIPFIK